MTTHLEELVRRLKRANAQIVSADLAELKQLATEEGKVSRLEQVADIAEVLVRPKP